MRLKSLLWLPKRKSVVITATFVASKPIQAKHTTQQKELQSKQQAQILYDQQLPAGTYYLKLAHSKECSRVLP